jgi:hypothetical protein
MTDSNRSDELPALMEERRKYESWLAALDARRESTAPHVFDRVKADYQSRLEQVETRLAAHRHSIEEERTSLVSRRSLLEAEEQLRRDERAELELRAHVGELAGADSDAAFQAVDDALGKLTEERDRLVKRIGELDALLAGRVESSNAAPREVEPEPLQVGEPEPEAAPPSPAVGHTPGGSFDEVAFMSDVVGVKEPAARPSDIVRDEPDAESLLANLREREPGQESPLAANVAANTPIVLRSTGQVEQAKTLKCNECGAMNYPTEWYCERCGAELAAL